MIKYIATITDKALGLIEESQFSSDDQEIIDIFLNNFWIKKYDDTSDPEPPKGINDYVEGISYPAKRFLIKEGHLIKSIIKTSMEYIPAEWEVKI